MPNLRKRVLWQKLSVENDEARDPPRDRGKGCGGAIEQLDLPERLPGVVRLHLTEGAYRIVLQKSVSNKSVNLSLIITNLKDKLWDLCGN